MNIYKMLVFLFLILAPNIVLAQCGDVPCDAPIEGGLSILIATGVGLGVKKIRDANKKDKDSKTLINE